MCYSSSSWVPMYAILFFFHLAVSHCGKQLEFCFRRLPFFFAALISSDLGMGGLFSLIFVFVQFVPLCQLLFLLLSFA